MAIINRLKIVDTLSPEIGEQTSRAFADVLQEEMAPLIGEAETNLLLARIDAKFAEMDVKFAEMQERLTQIEVRMWRVIAVGVALLTGVWIGGLAIAVAIILNALG